MKCCASLHPSTLSSMGLINTFEIALFNFERVLVWHPNPIGKNGSPFLCMCWRSAHIQQRLVVYFQNFQSIERESKVNEGVTCRIDYNQVLRGSVSLMKQRERERRERRVGNQIGKQLADCREREREWGRQGVMKRTNIQHCRSFASTPNNFAFNLIDTLSSSISSRAERAEYVSFF